MDIRSFAKRIPFARAINSYLWRNNWLHQKNWQSGSTTLNILTTFPMFNTTARGDYQLTSQLTIKTINQIIPALNSVAMSSGQLDLAATHIDHFARSANQRNAGNELKGLFNKYGSDKSTAHDYHKVYGRILEHRDKIGGILEIGLGTNDAAIVSTMGRDGKPGASLKAFRDFLPHATIFGADIDKKILFNDDRIHTFFVDQTSEESYRQLDQHVPSDLDLVIDDGLHTPDSNIATMLFGMTKIKKGGWVVIEDIGDEAIPLWQLVASLLPKHHKPYLLRAERGVMFLTRRIV